MRDGRRTRERIERTALKLFVENGVTETSIRDIAREAGVSQGAMYNHYASKEDLAWILFSENFSEIGTELRRIAAEDATLCDKFHSMIGYVFKRFEEDWTLVSYVFLVRHKHLKRVTPRLGNPYLAFRMLISQEVRRKSIPPQNLDVAASLVTGAIIQVIDSHILGQIRGKLTKQTDQVARACVAILTSQNY
jgi:AcrR family transcriptional regulator